MSEWMVNYQSKTTQDYFRWLESLEDPELIHELGLDVNYIRLNESTVDINMTESKQKIGCFCVIS